MALISEEEVIKCNISICTCRHRKSLPLSLGTYEVVNNIVADDCSLLSKRKAANLLGLRGDLGRELLLRLQQPLLGQLRAPVAVVDEDLEVLARLRKRNYVETSRH